MAAAILAIETSAPEASVALVDATSSEVLYESVFTTDRSHNSEIFGPIKEALDTAARQLDLVVVGVGPGSYSGVRVGIAVANGISIATGAQVLGGSSLEAYTAAETGGCYHIVGDARRKTFYHCQIESGSLQGDPEMLDEAAFAEKLASLDGDAAPIYTVDKAMAAAWDAVQLAMPSAVAVARTALSRYPDAAARQSIPTRPIEPYYLRPPYITKAKKKPVPGFPGTKL